MTTLVETNTLAELFTLVFIFALVMIAGAFSMYFRHFIQIFIYTLVPASATLLMVSTIHELLQTSYDIEDMSNIEYAVLMAVVAVLLWSGLFLLVWASSKIANAKKDAMDDDFKRVTFIAKDILSSTMTQNKQDIIQVLNTTMAGRDKMITTALDEEKEKIKQWLNEIRDNYDKTDQHIQNLQESIDQINMLLGVYAATHKDSIETIKHVIKINTKMSEQYKILVARNEALAEEKNAVQREREELSDRGTSGDDRRTSNDKVTSAVLTTSDGRASRIAGREEQDRTASYLKTTGLDVKSQHGSGEADITVKKDGKYTGIISHKAFSLYDEKGRKQRRISDEDCKPEISLARIMEVPMVIIVRNMNNGSTWATKIPHKELALWQGISTPVILAKDDEISRRTCKEAFLDVLTSLGAKV